jgi:hypothetical protein
LVLALVLVALVLGSGASKAASLTPSTHVKTTAPGAGGMCDLCINFALVAINDLLNIILNSGIITGCSDLCTKLPNKYEADVCDVLCDAVGIDEFIKILEKDDIDPVRGIFFP